MQAFALRRHFLAALGGAVASSFLWGSRSGAAPLPPLSSRFKLSIITDEIAQDFGHALEIASRSSDWLRRAANHVEQERH